MLNKSGAWHRICCLSTLQFNWAYAARGNLWDLNEFARAALFRCRGGRLLSTFRDRGGFHDGARETRFAACRERAELDSQNCQATEADEKPRVDELTKPQMVELPAQLYSGEDPRNVAAG